jgi:hypothetical protein
MTIDDFRRIASSMPGAEELSGLGYPNFCATRNSFATIEDSTAAVYARSASNVHGDGA